MCALQHNGRRNARSTRHSIASMRTKYCCTVGSPSSATARRKTFVPAVKKVQSSNPPSPIKGTRPQDLTRVHVEASSRQERLGCHVDHATRVSSLNRQSVHEMMLNSWRRRIALVCEGTSQDIRPRGDRSKQLKSSLSHQRHEASGSDTCARRGIITSSASGPPRRSRLLTVRAAAKRSS